MARFESIDKQIKRGYNMAVSLYDKSQDIIVVRNCFAFMFTNIGDTTARLNGMVIFPSTTPGSSLGDSRSISGHLLDIYAGVMRLSFDTPAGAAPLVEIVQLFYID